MKPTLMIKITWICLIQVALLLSVRTAFALEQHAKLWIGENWEHTFSVDQKWSYLVFTQARFINQSHPWQSTLLEGGVGYALWPTGKVWLGYRWSAHQPNNGFFQENRLWQQVVWTLFDNDRYKINARTRVEESEYGNESQIACRLRQRFSLYLFKNYFKRIDPLFYEEAFFQLHKTNYTSTSFFNENRLFIGFNLYTSTKTFWEIGYINQYGFATPNNNQNQMNHVAAFTYNII